MKKVTVHTRTFETSHGRNPKGFGAWMFCVGDNPEDMSTWVSFTGTFAKARAFAVQQARSVGAVTVTVLP